MLKPAEEISDTQIGKLTVKTVCHFSVAGGRLEDEMTFLNKISNLLIFHLSDVTISLGESTRVFLRSGQMLD